MPKIKYEKWADTTLCNVGRKILHILRDICILLSAWQVAKKRKKIKKTKIVGVNVNKSVYLQSEVLNL